MLPSQLSSPAPGRHSQPPPVEKSPPAKPEKALERRRFQAEAEQRQHIMFSDYYTLLLIFDYLNVQDLLRAARVCRMWRDLAMHPSLWKTMRMKDRCEVTDWNGFAEALKTCGTQRLDLRGISVGVGFAGIWENFVFVIPGVTNLVKLELCKCPVVVVEEVIKNCPQLEVLTAVSMECGSLNLKSAGNLKRCQELKLKATNSMSLKGDLSPLQTLTQLTRLSVTTVKELGKRRIDILGSLTNLETLELGECSDLPEHFFTRVLLKLHSLRRLRLEEGQGSCCTFDILEGVSKLENLSQLELVNFGVKNGFDEWLANCKNTKKNLVKLELCKCPVVVLEEVIKNYPQLEVLSAMSMECDSLNLESVGNLKRCQELKFKAINSVSLVGDLSPLQTLTQLTHLSVTGVHGLGLRRIDVLESLTNLETLELGECSDFPKYFGTRVLLKLHNLRRLRLEEGQGSCCTFDILEGVSKLENLSQLELVNFGVKNGFDKCLANCKNIKNLMIIPTYMSKVAVTNNIVLSGIMKLSNNLTHFFWGITLNVLRVAKIFVITYMYDQMNEQVAGDFIPLLKPLPCLKLIEDMEKDDSLKGDNKMLPNLTDSQVYILRVPQLEKLLLTALPKTRVEILKIPDTT